MVDLDFLSGAVDLSVSEEDRGQGPRPGPLLEGAADSELGRQPVGGRCVLVGCRGADHGVPEKRGVGFALKGGVMVINFQVQLDLQTTDWGFRWSYDWSSLDLGQVSAFTVPLLSIPD